MSKFFSSDTFALLLKWSEMEPESIMPKLYIASFRASEVLYKVSKKVTSDEKFKNLKTINLFEVFNIVLKSDKRLLDKLVKSRKMFF